MRANKALIYKLERIDWDYAGDSCSSVFSSIHWHPCRFVAQIPAALIGLLSDPGDVVIDPYCGSGTTLVEAQRLNRRALGIDVNPTSILIADSKLYQQHSDSLIKSLTSFRKRLLDTLVDSDDTPGTHAPHTVQTEKWYHPRTLAELQFIWSRIERSKSKYTPIYRAAFSSILLNVCSETRHWGYVCDNTRPKAKRYVDAISFFVKAMDDYISAYKTRDEGLDKSEFPLLPAETMEGDAETLLKTIGDNSIDLILTSPPYFGVCDYVKAQRLTMEWLGLELEEYRKRETGARSKRHRKKASVEYISDLRGVLRQSYRVLKKGKYIALILGESSSRKETIRDVIDLLSDTGFDTILNTKRSVSIQRRLHPSIKEEHVLVGVKK